MQKIVVIIAITTIPIITIIGILYFVNNNIINKPDVVTEIKREIDNIKVCEVDSDCVPATCCHATDVINRKFMPNCSGIKCTMSCDTILDCKRGKPVCDNGKCVIKENINNSKDFVSRKTLPPFEK